MTASPRLIRLVELFWKVENPHLADRDAARFGREMLDERRAEESLNAVAGNVPFRLQGRRLLEIGCGVGTLQYVARARGIHAFGVEPAQLGVRAGWTLFEEQGCGSAPIVCAAGERLPFPDAVFDVVCSFQVLEHTRDPGMVLSETVRVLRPGGSFVHVFPNYGSFWEGHYGVPWIPHIPKVIARFYIRLLGDNLAVLEGLQLLTHQSVAGMLEKHPNVRIKDWGFSLWAHRLQTLEFSEWAYLGRVKQMVRWLHRLGLVHLMIALGRRLHFETPIVLVGEKT